MLLARKGFRVLAVDRASFPSDTLSTHQIQEAGVARLHRWGLLDRVLATGAPPTRRVRFDQGEAVLQGSFPPFQGVDTMVSPRRTVLDAILVDAARQAGAEVRERFAVDELTFDGDRVTGLVGRDHRGQTVRESARMVVGADGKHSMVARAVRAPVLREVAPRTLASYTYWSGVPLEGAELYGRPGRAVGAFPTNDGLVITYVAWPIGEFDDFRTDIEGNVMATLDGAGDLGSRIREGSRVERIRTTPDLPSVIRRSHGPGWVLVGDAGLVMDPITGQGIGHAFRDAELVADAIESAVGGRTTMDAAMASYQQRRDAETKPMFDFTLDIAAFGPPRPEQLALMRTIEDRPDEVSRFLGVVSGATPIPEYFSPRNMIRLLGMRTVAKVMWNQIRSRSRRAAPRPSDREVVPAA
jgi:2-polyprenyl-6-methoxyphenol hydroxylase-like FAD-dependent oxidoreductase